MPSAKQAGQPDAERWEHQGERQCRPAGKRMLFRVDLFPRNPALPLNIQPRQELLVPLLFLFGHFAQPGQLLLPLFDLRLLLVELLDVPPLGVGGRRHFFQVGPHPRLVLLDLFQIPLLVLHVAVGVAHIGLDGQGLLKGFFDSFADDAGPDEDANGCF
jgi:hypothetical protein